MIIKLLNKILPKRSSPTEKEEAEIVKILQKKKPKNTTHSWLWQSKKDLANLFKGKHSLSSNINTDTILSLFKEFSNIPYPANSTYLFQCGIYKFYGKPLYFWDLVRQFEIQDGSEGDDSLKQLHLELLFKPNKKLEAVKWNKWSFDFKKLDDFFSYLKTHPYFHIVAGLKPHSINIRLEDI